MIKLKKKSIRNNIKISGLEISSNVFLQIKIVILLSLITNQLEASGLGDWRTQTPNGNSIESILNPFTLRLQNGKELYSIDKWYFYKNHIVGIIESNKVRTEKSQKTYFVVNEKSYAIEKFNKKSKWETHLTEHNLNPKLYTRWYSDNWDYISDLSLLLIFTWPLLIPILLFLLFLYQRFIHDFGMTKISSLIRIFICPVIFISVFFLLGTFPQSI